MSDPSFPVFLDLLGVPVVIVGGGAAAEARLEALLRAGARVRVVSPGITARIQARVTEGRAAWDRRAFGAGALEEAMLVFACTSDPAVQHQICEECRAIGVWVNRSDEPADSTFHLPHYFERGPVRVAVHAEPQQRALTERLTVAVAEAVGPEFGILSSWLSEPRPGERALRITLDDFQLDLCAAALKSNILGLLRAGEEREARTRFEDLRRQCEGSWAV